MLSMTKHQRELAEFLRTEYGATDTRLESGGKHPKLRFSYNGREHSYVVPQSPGDHRAQKNMLAQLRRTLGEPLPAAPSTPRKLEDMMPRLNGSQAVPESAPILPPSRDTLAMGAAITEAVFMPETTTEPRTWKLRAAGYKQSPRARGAILWFLFPPDIRKHFPGPVTIEKLDDEHWKVTRGGKKDFRDYGKKGSSYTFARLSFSEPGAEPFGASPAEAIEMDGEILIHLPMAGRLPVSDANQRRSPEIKQAIANVMAGAKPPVPSAPLPSLEDRMRACLAQVREIEAAGPYRLVRLSDGKLVWRAPVID